MSTDYSIFMHCAGPVIDKVRLLGSIDGVSVGSNGLPQMTGLDDVRIIELTERSRTIMKDDYGMYGVDVDWEITGTLDEDSDILEVIERLYRCMAAIANAYPDEECSLMRNGESLLAINTSDQVLISPTYLEAIPVIQSLFCRSSKVSEIESK